MKIRVSLALMMLLLSGLLGCSRQGAVTHSSARGARPSNTPQVGDVAEYSLTMNVTLHGASSAVPITGHQTYTVTSATDGGRTVPSAIVRSFNIVENHVQEAGGIRNYEEVIVWLGEDATGNLYLLGESPDGKNWDYVTNTTPPLYMPAEIRSGSAWQYTATFTSGNTERVTYRCVGKETLKTPAGEYNAYKLSADMRFTQLPDTTGYIWISSELPYVFEVKGEYRSSKRIHGMSHAADFVTTLQSVTRAK